MPIEWNTPDHKPVENRDLLVHGTHYPEGGGHMYYHCEHHQGEFYNQHAFNDEPPMYLVTHWSYINEPEV